MAPVRDERAPETLEERLRRLREEFASGTLVPPPRAGAPPPPKPWCDVDDRDEDAADGDGGG